MQTRLARSGTQEVLYQDYMMFARAKGIPRSRLIGRHLLLNILIPIVTITAIELGTLIAFSTVTETVFSWPASANCCSIPSIGLTGPWSSPT